MTFILISGDPDTGKTHVCQELRDILDQDPSFAKPATPKQVQVKEVLRHYEKKGKHIVLNSAADDDRCMERLARYIDRLGARPDIIITAIREKGCFKDRMLALLEEAAKGTSNLADYYRKHIAGRKNFAAAPLAGHTPVVLHLTKQLASGNNALASYWTKNASDAKRELDLIV
ncbi:MAG: hypothetical protein K2M90_01720 [Treponemataceae bacterium]|nr:hypothetical protein [Treponemataceae bacterium]MDE7391172.1 hypothetical protein [Treponemataceae bacterium]